jgi:hypothetical protein
MNIEHRTRMPYAMGVVCGAAAFILWAIFLFWNPYRAPDVQSALIPAVMSVLVLCGIGAALLRAPWGMLVFGAAALPIGLYVLLTPGIFKFIGVATIGFVLAALCAVAAARKPYPDLPSVDSVLGETVADPRHRPPASPPNTDR